MADFSLTPEQTDTLVRTVLGEAGGEGGLGMAAVAHNIRNRSLSGQYPTDPAQVALQPYQYSAWNSANKGGNNPNKYSPNSTQYQNALEVIQSVFGGSSPDPTNGALFYHNPSVNPPWASAVNQHGTTKIGNHIFYNGRPAEGPTPQSQSNTLRQQRDMIPSGASPALQSAMALLASSSTNPYPQNQSLDMMIRRSPGETIGTIPTTPSAQQMAMQNAARMAALGANQSFAGQSGAGPNKPNYQSALQQAQRIAALGANQSFAGQEGINLNNSRLPLGSPYQNYNVAVNGPPGLTPQQYANLPNQAPLPGQQPIPVTMSQGMMQRRNSGAAPFPIMASSGLQAQRNQLPMMGNVPPQAPPAGRGLKIVVDGAGSYGGQMQQAPMQAQTTGLTPVQTLQQQGLTNAQAYDLLNSLNRTTSIADRHTSGNYGGDAHGYSISG